MAPGPIPKSFIANHVSSMKAATPATSLHATKPAPVGSSPQSPTPAQNRAPAPAKNNNNPKPKPRPTPAKKKHGFFRRALGAVAGEVLKSSGHIGKSVVRAIHEDAMGSGGMPTNNASSGAVAGLGTGSQEPGVKKGRRAPRLSYKMFKRTKGVNP